jgi:hypothetical protein
MSAFDDAHYEPSPWEPIALEVARYEQTNGSEPSQIVGDHWIVLWTLGAKSGNVRKTPVVRVADEQGRYAVIGSMGGAPQTPAVGPQPASEPRRAGPGRRCPARLPGRRGGGCREGRLVGPCRRGLAGLRRVPGRHLPGDPALRPHPQQLKRSIHAQRGTSRT